MELLIYLGKVSLYWILLYGCYALLLRRHTFFGWNRAYLLGALLLSFALPLVQYPEASTVLPTVTYAADALPALVSAPAPFVVYAQSAPKVPLWEALSGTLYVAGVVFMLTRLVLQFRALFSFFQKGERIPMDDYTLVLLDNDQTGSFSFLNYIVINRTDYAENLDTILSHELAHVRQRHSWDILLVEVLQVVCWFNPVLILYKKSLQQVHEYLADRQAVLPRDRYADFLLTYALNKPANALINNFLNASNLKIRIAMLYKNRNSNWVLGQYAAVVVLVGFVSLLMAFKPAVMPEVSAQISQKIKVKGVVVDTDNKPLPNVWVKTADLKNSFLTDDLGQYELYIPTGSELIFDSENHKTVTVTVKEDQVIDAILVNSDAADSSVVAVYPYLIEKYINPGEHGLGQFIPRFMPDGGVLKKEPEQFKLHLLNAETTTVKGTVRSSKTKELLPGANVIVAGTTRGATTGANGAFELNEVPLDSKLAISYVGYETRVVEISRRSQVVNVVLAWQQKSLQDVVVVAYPPIGGAKPESGVEGSPSSLAQGEFVVVEQMPEFPGGVQEMYKFLARNIKYPTDAVRNDVEGKVVITFTVSEKGRVRDPQVTQRLGDGTDEEALRVVLNMPSWKPAKQNGRPVAMEYILPIEFKLDKPDMKEDKEKRQGNAIFFNYQMPEFKFENAVDSGSPASIRNFGAPEVSMPASGTSKTRYSNYSTKKMFPDVAPSGMIIIPASKFKKD